MEETLARRIANDLKGKTINRWKIEDLISWGYTAVVLRGRDERKRAAIKIYDPDLVKRLPADVAFRIDRQCNLIGTAHPNVVGILDGGLCQIDGTEYRYIAMDFVDSPTLDNLRGTLSALDIQHALRGLIDGVVHLDKNGLVHRDIKPSNIAYSVDSKQAIILDLGVIKPISRGDTGQSDSHAFLGTYAYTPPEVLDSQIASSDHAAWRLATVYQIGAVAYELVTGKHIFAEYLHNVKRLFEAIEVAPIPRPKRDDVPDDILLFIEHALRKKPHDRQTAASWTYTTEEFLRGRQPKRSSKRSRDVKDPTIVMLYAGGTIGASSAEREMRALELQPIADPFDIRLDNIEKKILSRARRFYAPMSASSIDIRWEIMPPDQQRFSENATTHTWNAITERIHELVNKYFIYPYDNSHAAALQKVFLSEKKGYDKRYRSSRGELTFERFLYDLQGRHVLGIIVLFGTDTLAYLGGALTFSLDRLPCPVVITGANRPFDEDSLDERDDIHSKSDAWENMLTAMYFLRSFGHRIAEVFTCFGSTVHHGLNLRKLSAENIPLQRRPATDDDVEPFTFRTMGLRRKYMFRLLDGLFINNYYPTDPERQWTRFIAADAEFRHISSPWWHPNRAEVRTFAFSDRVACVKITPGFPELREGDWQLSAWVVVLEVYQSGTYAKEERTALMAFLRAMGGKGIVVVLVSESGLIPGQLEYLAPKAEPGFPLLRLYRLIVETALPLISIVVARIKDEEWAGDGVTETGLHRMRTELLGRRVRAFLKTRKNVFIDDLGDVCDERSQIKKWRAQQDEVDHESVVDAATLHVSLGNVLIGIDGNEARSPLDGDEAWSVVTRSQRLWELMHECIPFERNGCTPDVFALQFDRGVDLGSIVGDAIGRRLADDPIRGDTYVNCDAATRERRSLYARSFLQLAGDYARNRGMSNLEMTAPVIKPAFEDDQPVLYSAPTIVIEAKVRRMNRTFLRNNEIYAVRGTTDAEEQFFRHLREKSSTSDWKADSLLAAEYARLNEVTFAESSSAIDWSVAGFCKGIACALLRHLRFDGWTEECRLRWKQNARYKRALRRSMTCSWNNTTDADELRISYTYISRLRV